MKISVNLYMSVSFNKRFKKTGGVKVEIISKITKLISTIYCN